MSFEVQTFCAFPSYIVHKRCNMPDEFNQRLYDVAVRDSHTYRVKDDKDPRNVGLKDSHLGHIRHNLLIDQKDPVLAEFARMIDAAVREYLKTVYHFDHDGDIEMTADTLWQRREIGENTGIHQHTHIKHDIVATYYPKVDLDKDCPEGPLRRGAVRFYDPGGVGKRLWKNRNPMHHIDGWLSVEPKTGSLLIFEGHVPHDSTYFQGDDRMCIPVLCEIKVPSSHNRASLRKILECQGI